MALRVENHGAAGQPQLVPKGEVLLGDDDRGDLVYHHPILQEQRHNVWARESYEEGACCVDSEAFDLVIVSQGSRSFEGRRVLERATEIDRRLPVLVLTRRVDMECYLEAMQLGAVDYLEKPLTVSEAVRVLETHLRPRQAGS